MDVRRRVWTQVPSLAKSHSSRHQTRVRLLILQKLGVCYFNHMIIRNLLLSNESVLKISDLGVSKITTSTLNTYSIAGTREYMSPEIQKCGGLDDESESQNGWHSAKTDIWFVNRNFLHFLLIKKIYI